MPGKPFWFIKPSSSLCFEETETAPGRSETHHELELGIVIGTRARRVSAEDAMNHVGGYCLGLDMTDRAGQAEAKAAKLPWTKCKAWDASCPVSDVVPASNVPDYRALNMWFRVNREDTPRQFGSPAQMIFDVPTLISAISMYHTLEVGDLILTGTPEGVGAVTIGDTITAGITELPECTINTVVVKGADSL